MPRKPIPEPGDDAGLARFERLAAQVRAAPARFRDPAALAASAGSSRAGLEALLRTHAHLTSTAWLRAERTRAACRMLLTSRKPLPDVADATGFASPSAFHREFLATTRMTPLAYRELGSGREFVLLLGAHYRAREILAYQARDPDSPSEKVLGQRIFKALTTREGPLVLEISLEGRRARCVLHMNASLSRQSVQEVHRAALRILGLTADVGAFEARMARHPAMAALLARRRGLRLPLTPSFFEGLCWAIIGQQINVRFASTLRREIILLAGAPVDGMRTHPTPERLAALDERDLTTRRYSRSKAEYLLGAARAVVSGALDLERLESGSALAAERLMIALRGIGIWTARYTLMRGAGFADCAPVGDVALAAALKNLTGAAERPGPEDVEQLMRPFAPYRSLATCHLWASLKEDAGPARAAPTGAPPIARRRRPRARGRR